MSKASFPSTDTQSSSQITFLLTDEGVELEEISALSAKKLIFGNYLEILYYK